MCPRRPGLSRRYVSGSFSHFHPPSDVVGVSMTMTWMLPSPAWPENIGKEIAHLPLDVRHHIAVTRERDRNVHDQRQQPGILPLDGLECKMAYFPEAIPFYTADAFVDVCAAVFAADSSMLAISARRPSSLKPGNSRSKRLGCSSIVRFRSRLSTAITLLSRIPSLPERTGTHNLAYGVVAFFISGKERGGQEMCGQADQS